MKSAAVVIGANFGDEGKGLITDFLCARDGGGDVAVVRFNGGAQAGHTVVTQDDRRHVFSHFGSGTFTGAETVLSCFFVSNPLLFAREHELLRKSKAIPRVSVDGASPVTTPYDMMINQIAEEARGDKRHGSCGVGFGETLERTEKSPSHAIFCRDLRDKAALKAKLAAIRRDWVPQRLVALGIAALPAHWRERVESTGIEEKFLQDSEFFLDHSTLTLGLPDKKLVFEGAQGLLLCQDSGFFPHVTRSNTGLKNAMALAVQAGIEKLDVHYITRAYLTRHGAGPLAHELQQAPYKKVSDQTNVVNPYQGHLRFSWLDAALLGKTVKKDLSAASSAIRVDHGLAVTCLDQVDDEVCFRDGELRRAGKQAFLAHLREKTGAGFMLCSQGPSRKDVSAC